LDENLQNRDAFINQINSFLQWIYSEYSSQANFRVIKKILRQANQSYSLKKATERGPFRWFIMLEASKLLYNKEWKTFADTRREEKWIKNNSNIFTAYICMLILSINRVTWVRHLDSIYDNKDWEYTLKSLSKYYWSNTEIRIEDSIDTITYSSNFWLYSNENYNEYLIIPLNYF
jgi:hypothetical protein